MKTTAACNKIPPPCAKIAAVIPHTFLCPSLPGNHICYGTIHRCFQACIFSYFPRQIFQHIIPDSLIGIFSNLRYIHAADRISNGHIAGTVKAETEPEIQFRIPPVPVSSGHVGYIFTGGIILDKIIIIAVQIPEVILHFPKILLQIRQL